MWRPTRADWKYFKGYTYLWEFGLRHIVRVNEKVLELIFGLEGRYKLQMRHYTNLNDFGLEIQGRTGGDSYHPIFGTQEDPFTDTRRSLLRKRLAVFGHGD